MDLSGIQIEPVIESISEKIRGRIINLNPKGYGFITSKEKAFTRIFFHWTSLRPDTPNFTELTKGMEVEFFPVYLKDQGWRALKIKVVVEGGDTNA